MTTLEKIILFAWIVMVVMFVLWLVAAIFWGEKKFELVAIVGKVIAVYASVGALAAMYVTATMIWRS